MAKPDKNFTEKVLIPVEPGVKARLTKMGLPNGATMTQAARQCLMAGLGMFEVAKQANAAKEVINPVDSDSEQG